MYEAFTPQNPSSDRPPNLVFLEIELKNNSGFYAGQLSQFAIVKDDEPHKPVYIISAYFKATRHESYEPVQADGILLDLSDAILVRVTQTPPSQDQTEQD